MFPWLPYDYLLTVTRAEKMLRRIARMIAMMRTSFQLKATVHPAMAVMPTRGSAQHNSQTMAAVHRKLITRESTKIPRTARQPTPYSFILLPHFL